jgi:Peptidase family M1 domain
MKKQFGFLVFLLAASFFTQCHTPKTSTVSPPPTPPSISKNNNSTVSIEKKVEFERWQQRAEYTMAVDFDHTKHQYSGKQKLVYFNNSPDELNKVFYHLYMNAFQPSSAMDTRSRSLPDPDGRVTDRISKLKPDEIGYLKIKSLTLNGKPCQYITEGTILEVTLPEKIAPLSNVTFEAEFEGQVPIQIRRNGRNNREGVDYSMAQWYPKMCEYDYQGWHANPYIAREFYGIWGDFDVTINIDQKYTVAASAYLQNPLDIGKGYAENATPKPVNGKLSWHFKAQNVHDFMWAADPEYKQVTKMSDNGILLRFFYIPSAQTAAWAQLPNVMAKAFPFMCENFGQYPYKEFMTIQGGDGGMEYPMSTLIRGTGGLQGLTEVTVHEGFHSWYQGVLATNESLYGWMDEGFTTYAENTTLNYLKQKKLVPAAPEADPIAETVENYCRFSQMGTEEALSTHADHFNTNRAYSMGAYVKGATFLQQLNYIEGADVFKKAMLTYFDTWKFKHPNANDFVRIHEKASGLELDWFKEYFVNTIHTIDYGIDAVSENGKKTQIILKRVGIMPMPLDIAVTYTDGTKETFYIPLDIMRGEKANETPTEKRTLLPDWTWVYKNYTLDINVEKSKIAKIDIDPSKRMADVNSDNNTWSPK